LEEEYEAMSAINLVPFGEESEVFEVERSDILRMVSTQSTDEAGSDENATDNFQPCSITVTQALEHAWSLTGFAMTRPDQFGDERVNALQDAHSEVTKLSSAGKKQTSLLDFLTH
jgi:hypothetical protein